MKPATGQICDFAATPTDYLPNNRTVFSMTDSHGVASGNDGWRDNDARQVRTATGPLRRITCWMAALGVLLAGVLTWIQIGDTGPADGGRLLFINLACMALFAGGTLWIVHHFIFRDLRRIAKTDAHAFQHVDDDLARIEEALDGARQQVNDGEVRLAMQTRRCGQLEAEVDDLTKALAARGRSLSAANKEHAEICFALSHDLKSPANTLSLIVSELEIEASVNLDEETAMLLEMAGQTSARLSKILQDVHVYSTVISDTMNRECVALSEVLADELRKMQVETLDATISFGLLPEIDGVPEQMAMLFRNLIDNALKFRSSERKPELSIRWLGRDEHGMEVISFADNGIGIPRDCRQQVFRLFGRLHGYEDYPGSGVGLTLCRRIVHNHGGSIEVRGAPSDGADFVVRLPGR
ncbi:sensor histidine kinase [Algicella marina]|uniref:histidine kinase n=1 Tax=Algicella marina TaxID=2683284 RepID=A0A6P1T544_9RHOB|nr:ATP-binding protein [Algicella marina]QHQ36865.1 hypothetical protein GO499_17585 [Algicella marina]